MDWNTCYNTTEESIQIFLINVVYHSGRNLLFFKYEILFISCLCTLVTSTKHFFSLKCNCSWKTKKKQKNLEGLSREEVCSWASLWVWPEAIPPLSSSSSSQCHGVSPSEEGLGSLSAAGSCKTVQEVPRFSFFYINRQSMKGVFSASSFSSSFSPSFPFVVTDSLPEGPPSPLLIPPFLFHNLYLQPSTPGAKHASSPPTTPSLVKTLIVVSSM